MRGMRNCAGFVHEGMKICARFVHEEGMTNRAGFVDKASERVCMTNVNGFVDRLLTGRGIFVHGVCACTSRDLQFVTCVVMKT
jgi:hypothetical protein